MRGWAMSSVEAAEPCKQPPASGLSSVDNLRLAVHAVEASRKRRAWLFAVCGACTHIAAAPCAS